MEFVRKKFPFTRTLNHLIESCPVEDKLALIEAFHRIWPPDFVIAYPKNLH